MDCSHLFLCRILSYHHFLGCVQNGSLWYEQVPHGDSGEFGVIKSAAKCDSLRWANGAQWCRGTSTTCLGPPLPPPPPPPPPSAWIQYPVPTTGVTFSSSDPSSALVALFTRGERLAAGNIKSFRQDDSGQPVYVMVEGAEYGSAWIETQPIAGAMYAQRNVRVGLNNQLIYLRSARSDGFMAHRIDANPSGHSLHPVYFTCDPHCSGNMGSVGIQGLYLAYPAVDVAFYLNLSVGDGVAVSNDATVAYLHEVREALANYDTWMWTQRNDSQCCSLVSAGINASCCPSVPSPGSGAFLWSSGTVDTGEDASDKYADNRGPIQSMDMLGYSEVFPTFIDCCFGGKP